MKMSEWCLNGRWYVADVSDLAHGSAQWWRIPRKLNMDLCDYVLMIKDKYHASSIYFVDYGEEDKRNSMLSFNFEKYSDAHKFLLDMNRRIK